MAYNTLSARQLPADDPFYNAIPSNLPFRSRISSPYRLDTIHGDQSVSKTSYTTGHAFHDGENGNGPGFNCGRYSQIPGYAQSSQQMTPALVDNFSPSVHGNMQYQPDWGLASPPMTGGYLPKMHTDGQGRDIQASLVFRGNLPQTPTKQQESDLVNSQSSRKQNSSTQKKSVKHLTCWYWANRGCRLPESVCLYSHFHTGRLAEPPVQVERGRPAVAGKNASNAQPIYHNWKGQHQAHSAVVSPRIQGQIKRFHDLAKLQKLTEVITDLANIVELLEINYGISVDHQTNVFQSLVNIAQRMEKEAREAGNAESLKMTRGPASDVAASSTSAPQHGHLPANHERIITAMDGF